MSSWKNNKNKGLNKINCSSIISTSVFSDNYKGNGIVNNYNDFINATDKLATCSTIRDYFKETKLSVSNSSDNFWNYKDGVLRPCKDTFLNSGIKLGGNNTFATELLEIVSNTQFQKNIDVINSIKTPLIIIDSIESNNTDNFNINSNVNFTKNINAKENVYIKNNLTINNELRNNGLSFFKNTNVENITFNDGTKLNSADFYSKYDVKKILFDINNGKIDLISKNNTFTSNTLDSRYFVNNTDFIQTKKNSSITQSGSGLNEIKQINNLSVNKIIQKGNNSIITTEGSIGIGVENPKLPLHIINSDLSSNSIVKFSFLDKSDLEFNKNINENISINVTNNLNNNGKLILQDNINGRVGICNNDPNYHLSVNGITNSSLYYSIIDSKTRFNAFKIKNNLELIKNLVIYKFEKIIEPKTQNNFEIFDWGNFKRKTINWKYEYGFSEKNINNSELKDIICKNENLLSIDYNSIISICIGSINELKEMINILKSENMNLKNQQKKNANSIASNQKQNITNRKLIDDLFIKYNDLNSKYEELCKNK